jgi:hypothetical protein
MNRTFTSIWITVLLAAGLSGPISAQETFVAALTGPRAGTTSSATGTATLVLDGSATRIDFTISHNGLSSREVGSHIHYIQGGIAFTLPKGNPKVGTWTSPTALDIFRLRAGELFINIHTDDHPTGEIAGDLVTAPTPVDAATWGRIKALFGP